MKNVLRLFVSILVVTLLSFSGVVQAQTWDLADGVLASIPDPNNLATAANPVTVGTATWTFRNGGGTAAYATAVKTPDVGGAHVELPEGVMWYNAGGLPGLGLFSAVQDVPSPCSALGPCTNYGPGDVGGYTSTGAVWTTSVAGTFDVTWGGYAGRAFVNDPPRFMDAICFSGPAPLYNMDPHPGGRTLQGVQPVTQLDNLGAANAVTNTFRVSLVADEAIDLYFNNGVGSAGGGDWAGLLLTIVTVAPGTDLTISTNPGGITTVTPFANETQSVVPEVPIAINALPFFDCPTVLGFDHWVADSGASIADANSAATTVTVTTAGVPGAITAHYVDASQCGDVCHESVASDITGPGGLPDCIVDLLDLAFFASQFLIDNSPQ